MIKTFRGTFNETDNSDATTIANTVERIYLAGGDANTGFRIRDIRILPERPVIDSNEAVVKLYSSMPTTAAQVGNEINFKDSALAAVALWSNKDDTTYYPDDLTLVIDHEMIFTQDLYLTYNNPTTSGRFINYIITLEEVKIKDSELAVVNYSQALLNE